MHIDSLKTVLILCTKMCIKERGAKEKDHVNKEKTISIRPMNTCAWWTYPAYTKQEHVITVTLQLLFQYCKIRQYFQDINTKLMIPRTFHVCYS